MAGSRFFALVVSAAAASASLVGAQEPDGGGMAPGDAVPESPAEREALEQAFASGGFTLDLERREIRVPVRVNLLWDPLEFLLVVEPAGKTHESLFATDHLDVVMLNTAMLLLGMTPGEPGRTEPIQPRPTPEEVRQGADTLVTTPPRGPGFYLTARWTETMDDGRVEEFCYRAEDLVLNARDSRTYARGPWVYVGSRLVKSRDGREYLVAERSGDLIALVVFGTGDELLAGADPDAGYQDIWFPNVFLLPEVGHDVELVFTLEPPKCPLARVEDTSVGPKAAED